MCELLVRIVDKTNDDPYLDAACTKAGDVIAVAEDGHEWGRAEGPPDYRVIRVPGVPGVDLHGLLGRQLAEKPHQRTLRARAFGLRMDDLSAEMTLDQVTQARFRKTYLQDPNVLE